MKNKLLTTTTTTTTTTINIFNKTTLKKLSRVTRRSATSFT